MAEFSEVMKQLNRMCDAHPYCTGCILCEMNYCGHIGVCSSMSQTVEQIERIVMAWAKEHPEPQYPTWDEWLTEMGILQSPVPVPNMTVVAYYGGLKAHDRIPADIAEKLGLKPKGANGDD